MAYQRQGHWEPGLTCPVPGCTNQADPRCPAHLPNGHIVCVCDGCFEPCPGGDPSACICRTGCNHVRRAMDSGEDPV